MKVASTTGSNTKYFQSSYIQNGAYRTTFEGIRNIGELLLGKPSCMHLSTKEVAKVHEYIIVYLGYTSEFYK